MSVIHVEGETAAIDSSPVRSVLASLLMAAHPIRHDCGGRAMCGTCLIRIVSSSGSLSPVSDREAARLRAIHARPDERLACQCRASGDIVIQLRNAIPKA